VNGFDDDFSIKAHTGTIEEDEVTKAEKLSQTERLSVETFCGIDVLNGK
jgi:hypothetical protein